MLQRHDRRRRSGVVNDLVSALNALDYKVVRRLLSPQVEVTDAVGRQISGVDAFIASDREFRTRAGQPRIEVLAAIENADGILISGMVHSTNRALSGPACWRLAFDGERVSRIEITRSDQHMTVTKFHALQNN